MPEEEKESCPSEEGQVSENNGNGNVWSSESNVTVVVGDKEVAVGAGDMFGPTVVALAKAEGVGRFRVLDHKGNPISADDPPYDFSKYAGKTVTIEPVDKAGY